MKTVQRIIFFLKNWSSQNKILAAILLLSAILRFGGVYPGYPATHPDEGAIYGTAVKMILRLSYDPMRYDYAALPMILHVITYLIFNPFFIAYSFIFNPDNLPKFKNVLDFYQQILWHNQQTALIYWSRFITAVFGVGIVFMVYLVAIKYFSDKKVALSAAFLTAVNFRQVLNSRLILPDIYNAFFLLLCFYVFANLLKKPNRKHYFLSGIIIGLYFSVKFHVFSVPAFGIAHLINTWNSLKEHSLSYIIQNKKIFLRTLFKLDFIVSLLLIPIVFVIVNPYLVLHWTDFIDTSRYQALQYRLGINNLDTYSISYLYHIGIGKIISIFILLGIIWGIKKHIIPTVLLLSAILPFFYFLTYYGNGGFYTRNFVSITPVLLIFAGLFLVEICLSIGKYFKLEKKTVNFLIILLLIIISWGQVKNSLINTYYFAQPQSPRSANLWAQENIPDGSIIAARTVDKFPRKKEFKIINFEYNDTYSLAEMQEKGVDYGYVALDELNLFFYWWMKQDTRLGLAYWEKQVTDSISQNMFAAKVAQELASWAVADFVKPWQAPGVNYFVVKIPKKIELTRKKVIKEFGFDTKDDLSSWSLISGYSDKIGNITLDQSVGHKNNGAVLFDTTSAFPNVIRAVSPIIPLKNSSKSLAYELTGWIKTGSPLIGRERDGFLEIDFYENDPKKVSLTTKISSVALSSRVYGTDEWVKKNITVIASKNAKFMTISLGINDYRTPIWFDDLTISQSEDVFDDPRTTAPYLNYYQIPQNVLFPVSHGNL
ncbi:MAG: phospholipid carrier-dependent glycosyltransferase [Candidatus Daviesbacteria bacterium]|nr:phospholipid carrier-dependent glycosyltransferase [Candidatus Daviesbacteria bacterium]